MFTEHWITNPGLPENAVTLCAVSGEEAARPVRRALERMNIRVIPVDASELLAAPCASHPDMLLCHLGGEQIAAGSTQVFQRLKEARMQPWMAQPIPQGPYPDDVRLNCLLLGKRLLGRPCSLDASILSHAALHGYEVIPVSQGYTRCSVCVVDENSIITADPSIQKAAGKAGLDVLAITPGAITLPGYEYGFIGGCCGLIGRKAIAFCGSLSSHPDGDRIRSFLSSKGISVSELPSPDGTLWDIGGILPLAEKFFSRS